ncbi:MAG: pseudouridine synthase [Rhodothermales bacterium]
MKSRRPNHRRSAGRPSSRGGSSSQTAHQAPQTKPVLDMTEPVRLNRFIASTGTCSRREADDLIAKGLVKVNGEVVMTMGSKVGRTDRVEVNGKRVVPADREYILLNKPKDTITTTDDEKGRTSVLDLLPEDEFRSLGLFPVGRLDRHTTGALLLTNDGDLAHRLMHPSYGVSKQYLVQTEKPVTEEDLQLLGKGIELEDGSAKADRVSYLEGDQRQLVMAIHEGRNRQVRRMIDAIGNAVTSLDRVRYAGLTTRGILKGKWRRLSRKEVSSLYRQVKL